ncbi:sensor histidine kinase [Piscinibacter sakaiensis]|uniref:sensor histidine kinase n=1 Tax=Piscinibacter sakaiensis TaxID=1547922 RepID=UPI003AB05925
MAVPAPIRPAPYPDAPSLPAAAPGRQSATAPAAGQTRRRPWLWVLLVCLLLVAQTALVWLTFDYESNRLQEEVDAASASIAAEIRHAVSHDLQSLQALSWREDNPPLQWRSAGARQLLQERRELVRIERRNADLRVTDALDSPYHAPIFVRLPRAAIEQETEIACAAAARTGAPSFSRSFFVPLPGDLGVEIVDVCLPVQRSGELVGYITASMALATLLNEVVSPALLQAHELSFINGDGSRLARAGRPRGAGIYVSERLIDLPGQTMRLRVDSQSGRPQLIPNLAVALVLGLSLALGAVVLLLARDMRRRSIAEHALAEALAFRKAMEDSLLTGLRARDIEGRVTYVNPAFCEMVGFSAAEIIGRDPPPYWPPEKVPEYRRRLQQRQSLPDDPAPRRDPSPRGNLREGFETTFMRKDGERFAVLIFDAPLVDGHGRQTGWMSAALDVSDQRRVEELSRQQQERLQATARLATVGEMASLLSHELNQPLAAISSYAAGSMNLLGETTLEPDAVPMLRQAIERIAAQAERAGKVIKSVHDFVRRRQQLREPVRVEALIEAVLPLMRLQARKSGARIEVAINSGLPRVVCDRTMVEQVLLNLTRNGIQAMEEATPLEQRELLIRVRSSHPLWVTFSVIDRGPGIAPEIAQRLFTPFFTTRSEGMGLGLSLCRTVIEQHGGALDHERISSHRSEAGDAGPATEFRFTLPAERVSHPARREETAQSA